MKDPVLIETLKGLGTVDKIYVSELGYLMLRIYFENGTFTTYNLGKHDPENNMFTDKIMKDEKKYSNETVYPIVKIIYTRPSNINHPLE